VSRFRKLRQREHQLDEISKTRHNKTPINNKPTEMPQISLPVDAQKSDVVVPANTKLGGNPEVHNLEKIIQSVYDDEDEILDLIETTNIFDKENDYMKYIKEYRGKYGFCFNIRDVSNILVDICNKKNITNFHEAMCGKGFIPIMMRYNDPNYKINITSSDIYDSSWYTSSDTYNTYNNIKSIIDKPITMSADNAISQITVPNTMVLLSWVPPKGDSGVLALKAILQNPNISYLVSIDEYGYVEDEIGCIGTDEYFDILKSSFKLEHIYERTLVNTFHDTMKLYIPIRAI
jgi:hypothetical protein